MPLRRILITLLCLTTAHAARSDASFVMLNVEIRMASRHAATAHALVIEGSRIRYLGTDQGARRFITPSTEVIDLHGATVLPGFQDSHVHPGDAPNAATDLDLHGIRSAPALLERIQHYADAHPANPWIVGDGWDAAAFDAQRPPTHALLDAIVRDRPVYLTNNAGHSAWVNQAALEAAGITNRTPDPPNGRIERASDGTPSGLLHEDAAMNLVADQVPPLSQEAQYLNLRSALDTLSRVGITSLIDAMTSTAIQAAYQRLAREGALHQHVLMCQAFDPTLDDDKQIEGFLERRAQVNESNLSANCVKLFLDGAYASHTLALLAPYSDDAQFGTGALFIDAKRLDRLVTRLDALGFQIHMHAQGDGAVHAGLDAFEQARRHNGPRYPRHTMAHLCLVSPPDLERFKRLGVIANMSPLWSVNDLWEGVMGPKLFGARSARLLPMSALRESRATLVFGSDWPVTGVAPLAGIETAVTHRYPGGVDPDGKRDRPWHPQGRITLDQAIDAYTRAGAYLTHAEADRGSLAVGKTADLVVLANSPWRSTPLSIHSIPVLMTIFEGRIIHDERPQPH